MRSKTLGNFIPKQPFDLAAFLSQPGKPDGGGKRRFGNANSRPRPAEKDKPAPQAKAPGKD